MKKFLKGLAAIVLFASVAFALPLGLNANAADNTNAYKYNLAFEDDFNGSVKSDWSIYGGKNAVKSGGTVTGWNLKGENHIEYESDLSVTTDNGKFLYGGADLTNYMFEVKVRADVSYTLGEYWEENAVDPSNLTGGVKSGCVLGINTHIPFFAASKDNANGFYGRSVCFNEYAIGFYQVDEAKGSGWATGATKRILTIFDGSFDWREWHTIRVEATATACKLYLDDNLMVNVNNSAFTKATGTTGACGFAAALNQTATQSPVTLHYDDFSLWTTNASYDSSVTEVEKTVQGINAADFRNTSKLHYQSGKVGAALEETGENAVVFNRNGGFGTDIRLLKDHSYSSFETTIAFDIELQKAVKEGQTKNVRSSLEAGFLFNGENANTATGEVTYNGYLLSYQGVLYNANGTKDNKTSITLVKKEGNASQSSNIQIGVISGTSCIMDVKVDGGYLYLTAYASVADYQAGKPAALNQKSTSVQTDENYSCKVALLDYKAEAGGAYTEGNIGFWCNTYPYSAKILSFNGKTTAAPDANEPVLSASTQTVSVTSTANGSVTVDGYAPVTINGAATNKAQTVATHGEVKLTFTPASGYFVKNVKINGYDHGAITSWNISNITCAYNVDVTFSRKWQVTFKDTQGNVLTTKTVWAGENTFTIANFGAQAVGFVRDNGVYSTWTGDIAAATDVTVLVADISLTKGASIRFDTPSGLRFRSNVSQDTYTALNSLSPTYGILMLTEEKRGNSELTLTSANVLKVELDGAPVLNGGAYQYRAAVANIPAEKYETEVAARGYVTVTLSDGATRTVYTPFSAEDNVRSISEVAQTILNDPQAAAQYAEYKELLESYANYAVQSLSFEAASVAQTAGTYPRMVKLTNGKYLLTADSKYVISNDGKTFGNYSVLPVSETVPGGTTALACGNAQPLVLSSGKVAIAYRAQRVADNGYASIRMIISTDAACTSFSDPVIIAEVYTSKVETGGMWEPFLVQKGNELLVYFSCDAQTSVAKNGVAANSAYVCGNGYQNVLLTKYDLSSNAVGETSVVYNGASAQSRPGMSVVTALADGSYAMAVECWSGDNCQINILYSKDCETWSTPKKLISLSGGACMAPYIVTLPTGQIALTFQTTAGYRGDYSASANNTRKSQLKLYVSENDVAYNGTVTLKEYQTGIELEKNDYLIWNGMAVADNMLYVFGCKGTVTSESAFTSSGVQIVYAKIYG